MPNITRLSLKKLGLLLRLYVAAIISRIHVKVYCALGQDLILDLFGLQNL